ncbi:hypothetical protein NCC49_000522 [Naganishia albida]|nr:hypothetical protein NCC49_000522 [Naganishia albida]
MAPGHVSPLFRALAPATRTGTALGRRTISQSARNAQAAVVGTEPIGTFFGFSLASAYASYYLLQEYKLASSLLQGSVEDLQDSTVKMSNHLQRIEAVEKELKRLSSTSAVKEDVTKLRAEMKQVYDGLHVEVLDLRAHVWGVEQDLARSASHNSIRI